MLANVFFFTGPEKYLLDKELIRRKENFVSKFGADSVFSFGQENMDFGMIKQSIYSGGLFVTKKLIIINGLPPSTPERGTTPKEEKSSKGPNQQELFIDDFIKREGKIPEESLLVFVNSKPDKRLRFYKFLEKNANVKEFAQLKSSDLESFVKKELSGLTIGHAALQHMISKIGPDMYRLRFECDKLKYRAMYKKTTTIDETMIDHIVRGDVETDSFSLLKTLLVDKHKAIQLLEKIHHDGTDRNQFAGMLYRALKFYLFMIDLESIGIVDSKEIALRLKMNPRQVKNEFSKIGVLKASKKNIEFLYNGLIELEAAIKTGKVPDTSFWLGIKNLIIKG